MPSLLPNLPDVPSYQKDNASDLPELVWQNRQIGIGNRGSIIDNRNAINANTQVTQQLTTEYSGQQQQIADNQRAIAALEKLSGPKQIGERDLHHLRAAIATASAIAALPRAVEPGTTVIGIAGGYHDSQNAAAIGISHRLPNQRWQFNGNFGVGRDKITSSIGLGYQF